MSNITLYLKPAQTWRRNDGGGVPPGCVGRQFNIFETKDGGPIIGYVVRTRGNAGQVCVYPTLYQLLCKINPNWRNGIEINTNNPVHGPNPPPWDESWCNVVPLNASDDFDAGCVCGDPQFTCTPELQFAYSRSGIEWLSQFFRLDFNQMKILHSDTRSNWVQTVKIERGDGKPNIAVIAPSNNKGHGPFALSFHDNAKSILSTDVIKALQGAAGWKALTGHHLGIPGGTRYFLGKEGYKTFCEAWCELSRIVAPHYTLVREQYHDPKYTRNPTCECELQ